MDVFILPCDDGHTVNYNNLIHVKVNIGGSSTMSVGPGPKIGGSGILSMQSALYSFKKAVFYNHFRFALRSPLSSLI